METALENETVGVLDVDNASNLTGRGAATPLGIAVTYSALFGMALGPILIGSLRSVGYHSTMKVSIPRKEQIPRVTQSYLFNSSKHRKMGKKLWIGLRWLMQLCSLFMLVWVFSGSIYSSRYVLK